jgi:hypothetical protein
MENNTMKKTIIVTTVCFLILAGYIAGQSQTKERHIEPCCCKHTQQIADDLHWIRKKMEKPFVPPPDVIMPGNPPHSEPIPVPKFNLKLEETNFNIPKLPKKR